jgi:hypothetical protein
MEASGKALIADPHMPRFVKTRISAIFDSLAADVKIEALELVEDAVGLHDKANTW